MRLTRSADCGCAPAKRYDCSASAATDVERLTIPSVRPLSTTAVALLVGTALALSGSIAAVAKTRSFRTPSKNIVCLYASRGGPGPYIRCDVLLLNDVGFLLDRRHKAKRIRVTDTVADPTKAHALRYGTSRRFGPFRCRSRPSGLTCKSPKSSHGFELSRQSQRLF